MLYTITSEKLSVTVSSRGAELQSVKTAETEYLWQGDPKYWTGRAPNLFPIVGRVKDGKYKVNGKEYEIVSPHGFTKVSEFDMNKVAEDTLVCTLKASEETLKMYPYDFVLTITYKITDNKLRTTYNVKNPAEQDMIFSVGAHPAFNVPLTDGESFEDYRIEFADRCTPLEVVCDNCFITGAERVYELENDRVIRLRHDLFDNDAIILSKMNCRKLAIVSDKSDKRIEVDFNDFHYLGIWHKPKMDAPYVCIEPWNGIPSQTFDDEELTRKPATVTLPAGKTYEVNLDIAVF